MKPISITGTKAGPFTNAIIWVRRHVLRQRSDELRHPNGEPVRPGDWVQFQASFMLLRGRVYDVKRMIVVDIVLAPPEHPSCRSTLIPA
jgi:hypothetical protein